MNPGAFVMAGGGAGGGGGGNGGDGSGGEQGADGNKGGEDGTGGGAGAGACGTGSGSGCGSHNPSVSRGDPVDVATGKVKTDAVVELLFGGPILLEFARSYSSAACDRDVGLGYGWNHTFGHQLQVRRGAIRLWKADGAFVDFPLLEKGASAIGGRAYELVRSGDGYVLDYGDGLLRDFVASEADPRLFRIATVRDSHDCRVALRYERDRLVEITDSVGRTVRFGQSARGRITTIDGFDPLRKSWVRFAEYRYDEHGDLIESVDADGFQRAYRYEQHLLTFQQTPMSAQFHYAYDGEGRCVETWCSEPYGRDLSLADTVSELLADGSAAKGTFHCKLLYASNDDGNYTECADSLEVQRFFSNGFGSIDKAVTGGGVDSRVYNRFGQVISHTDALGGAWITSRDERGRPVELIDPLGHTTSIIRDDQGHVVEVSHPGGGVTRYHRDAKGCVLGMVDPMEATGSFTYDQRGRLISETTALGATRSHSFDAYGNLVSTERPDGGRWRYEHDGFGRVTATVNPEGARIKYRYSARGDVTSVTDENGNVRSYQYDGMRNITSVTLAHGATYKFAHAFPDRLYQKVKPTGEVTKLRYNREGILVEVHNESGRVHHYAYSATRQLARTTGYGGREQQFEHDLVGRLTAVKEAAGTTFFEYDAAHRMIARVETDGSSTTFGWDPAGELVCAQNADARIELVRNAVGDVVQERQTHDGETVTVDIEVDGAGFRRSLRSSWGYHVRNERTAMGDREIIALDDDTTIRRSFDLLSLERERRLPGTGTIASTYDKMGRLAVRNISPQGEAPRAAGEPQWIGGIPAKHASMFDWSPADELATIRDSHRGQIDHDYDLHGRLLSMGVAGGDKEKFNYGPTGNPHNAAPSHTSQYGPSDEVTDWGDKTFVWDDDGRLTDKFEGGKTGRHWRYEWRPDGLLAAAHTPDGKHVTFAYDPLGRRLSKCVTDAAAKTRTTTRFVWSEEQVIEERTVVTAADGSETISGREYCHRELSTAPLAHADVTYADDGEKLGRTWYHYSNDPFGFPMDVVDQDGEIACRLVRKAYGAAEVESGARTTTPFRQPGQYADEETGLSYNRYRYYDPEVGQFISADPTSLSGGLNLYAMGVNPVSWLDPFGLTAQSDEARRLQQGTDNPRNGTSSTCGSTCVAVGLLSDDTEVRTQNNNGKTPSIAVRDPSEVSRSPGRLEGGLTSETFTPTTATRNPDTACHHAEQRMIKVAEEVKGRKIVAVSATNNCCDKCKAALIKHNKNINITDPNGNQVHP